MVQESHPRGRFEVSLATVCWLAALGALTWLWVTSFNTEVDCIYDSHAKIELCLYRGAANLRDCNLSRPRPWRFEVYVTSPPDPLDPPFCRIPLWVPALVIGFGGPAFVHSQRKLRIWLNDRRRKQGCCVHCGYDLRGSPERCPECGRKASPGE